MKPVPCRQLNVLWVVVCTQIEHCIDELDPLHFQDLQVCLKRNNQLECITKTPQTKYFSIILKKRMKKQLPLEKHNSAARHIFRQRLTYTALPVIINSYSLSESSHTIGLNSSSPLDQVICELHGIGWAQGQIT